MPPLRNLSQTDKRVRTSLFSQDRPISKVYSSLASSATSRACRDVRWRSATPGCLPSPTPPLPTGWPPCRQVASTISSPCSHLTIYTRPALQRRDENNDNYMFGNDSEPAKMAQLNIVRHKGGSTETSLIDSLKKALCRLILEGSEVLAAGRYHGVVRPQRHGGGNCRHGLGHQPSILVGLTTRRRISQLPHITISQRVSSSQASSKGSVILLLHVVILHTILVTPVFLVDNPSPRTNVLARR